MGSSHQAAGPGAGGMDRGLMATRWLVPLPALMLGCAQPAPDPLRVALDRPQSVFAPVPAAGEAAITPAGLDGTYAGLWIPDPAGSCAAAGAIRRDMLVEPSGAVSGVNSPLRGRVGPDGRVSLAYGKAAVVGQLRPDGFVGRANTGETCSWRVTMVRQPPIGHPPSAEPPPGATLVQGEIPSAPADNASLSEPAGEP